MHTTRFITIIIVSFFISFFSNALFADTIYLKNGSHTEGIIEREDKDGIELNLGFGTTTFYRSEIDHIVRSDAKEKQAIWQEWGERQKDIEKQKPEEERKWRERQTELERIRLEQVQAKKEKDEYGPKDIQVTAKNGSILVNVLLNEKIRATLVLDSGAASVMLSRKLAEQLDVDMEKLKKINTQVADGRTVQAGQTILESVKVQNVGLTDVESDKKPGVEVKNVEACVIFDSVENGKMEDGLLGMSFLKNFKFNADYKNSKVTFERLKDETAPADR